MTNLLTVSTKKTLDNKIINNKQQKNTYVLLYISTHIYIYIIKMLNIFLLSKIGMMNK